MLNPQESNFSQPINPLTSGLDNSNLINPVKALGTIQGAWTPDLNVNLANSGNSGVLSLNALAIQILDPSQIFVNQEIVNPAVANTFGLLGTSTCILGDFSKPDLLLSQNPRQIVFIDSTVNNYQDLEGVSANSEVVRLDANQNGVEQITGVLSHYQNVFSAVHIVSHGSVGALQLGSTIFNDNSLLTYQFDLQKWSTALTKNADILLYGCDISQGSAGHLFINDLASLTGADIAASSNLTGNSNLGGDWILEDKTGSIEASTLTASKDFNQVLGTLQINAQGTLSYSIDNGVLSNGLSAPTDYDNNIKISQISNFLLFSDVRINYSQSSAFQKTDNQNTVKIDLSKISAIDINTGNSGNDEVSVGDLNFNRAINLSVKFGIANGGTEKLILGGTINLAGGNLTVKEADEVTIGGNLLLNGGNLDITGEKTINILNQATVSTRRIALLADQLSDNNSIGNSGNITLRGSDITIGANVNLLAQASGYQAGNITIKAASTKDFLNYLSDFGLGLPGVFKLPGSEYKADISLGQNAILKGQDITLTAEAGGNKGDTNMIKEYAGTALRTITNFIVKLPVMVKVINTSATVEVASQSQIISSGDVKIQTNAVADSSLSVSSGDGALVAALSIAVFGAKRTRYN